MFSRVFPEISLKSSKKYTKNEKESFLNVLSSEKQTIVKKSRILKMTIRRYCLFKDSKLLIFKNLTDEIPKQIKELNDFLYMIDLKKKIDKSNIKAIKIIWFSEPLKIWFFAKNNEIFDFVLFYFEKIKNKIENIASSINTEESNSFNPQDIDESCNILDKPNINYLVKSCNCEEFEGRNPKLLESLNNFGEISEIRTNETKNFIIQNMNIKLITDLNKNIKKESEKNEKKVSCKESFIDKLSSFFDYREELNEAIDKNCKENNNLNEIEKCKINSNLQINQSNSNEENNLDFRIENNNKLDKNENSKEVLESTKLDTHILKIDKNENFMEDIEKNNLNNIKDNIENCQKSNKNKRKFLFETHHKNTKSLRNIHEPHLAFNNLKINSEENVDIKVIPENIYINLNTFSLNKNYLFQKIMKNFFVLKSEKNQKLFNLIEKKKNCSNFLLLLLKCEYEFIYAFHKGFISNFISCKNNISKLFESVSSYEIHLEVQEDNNEQIDYLLTKAEILMLFALIEICFKNQFKALKLLKKSWNIYHKTELLFKKSEKIIDSNSELNEHRINFGIGAFNLLLSIIPNTYIKILKIIGFKIDRQKGLLLINLLLIGIFLLEKCCKDDNIRSFYSNIFLFMFYFQYQFNDIKSLEILENFKTNFSDFPIIYYFYGAYYQKNKKDKICQDYFEKSLTFFSKKNKKEIYLIKIELAKSYFKNFQWKKALEIFLEYFEFLVDSNDFSDSFFKKCNFTPCFLSFFKKFIKNSKENNLIYPEKKIILAIQIASCYSALKDFENTENWLNLAGILFKKYNNNSNSKKNNKISEKIIKIGNKFLYRKKYDLLFFEIFYFLELFQDFDNNFLFNCEEINNEIINSFLEKYDLERKNYKFDLEKIKKNIDLVIEICSSCMISIVIFALIGKFNLVFQIFNSVEILFKELPIDFNYFGHHIYFWIGRVYYSENNFNEAIKFLKISKKFSCDLNLNENILILQKEIENNLI